MPDDHDHLRILLQRYHYTAAGSPERDEVLEEIIAEAVRVQGGRDGAHTVDWRGTFRGTDNDPRETGYCHQCQREVYDRDPEGHVR